MIQSNIWEFLIRIEKFMFQIGDFKTAQGFVFWNVVQESHFCSFVLSPNWRCRWIYYDAGSNSPNVDINGRVSPNKRAEKPDPKLEKQAKPSLFISIPRLVFYSACCCFVARSLASLTLLSVFKLRLYTGYIHLKTPFKLLFFPFLRSCFRSETHCFRCFVASVTWQTWRAMAGRASRAGTVFARSRWRFRNGGKRKRSSEPNRAR